MVYSSKLDVNLESHQFDLNHLKSGIYLMEMRQGNNSTTKK